MRHIEDIKRDIGRSQGKPNTRHQDHIDLIDISEHRERKKCWQALLRLAPARFARPSKTDSSIGSSLDESRYGMLLIFSIIGSSQSWIRASSKANKMTSIMRISPYIYSGMRRDSLESPPSSCNPGSRQLTPLAIKLHNPERQHGISHFDKPCDIGAFHVVTLTVG